MGRTRLWQSAGSTLIQGSSKRQKPFWVDWLSASGVAAAASYVLIVGVLYFQGTDLESALRFAWIPSLIGSCVGSAPVIWVAGKYGSLKRWPAGALGGILVSLVFAWWFATYLVAQLNG